MNRLLTTEGTGSEPKWATNYKTGATIVGAKKMRSKMFPCHTAHLISLHLCSTSPHSLHHCHSFRILRRESIRGPSTHATYVAFHLPLNSFPSHDSFGSLLSLPHSSHASRFSTASSSFLRYSDYLIRSYCPHALALCDPTDPFPPAQGRSRDPPNKAPLSLSGH